MPGRTWPPSSTSARRSSGPDRPTGGSAWRRCQPQSSARRSSAAWRTCQSRSVRAACSAASTSGPFERGERDHGPASHRGLVGGGGQDRRQPGRILQRAQRRHCRLTAQGIGMVDGHCAEGPDDAGLGRTRSPEAHAVTSTMVGSSSLSSGSRRMGPSPGRLAVSSTARRRTDRAGSWRAAASSASRRSPTRSRAPSAVARTEASTSSSSARAAVASPWWPASAAARRRRPGVGLSGRR